MPRLFDSFIMVDWSAASKPTTGKDSIWIGALVPDARLRLTFRASNPATRAEALNQLEDLLTRLTNRGDRILLGFDFPLGFPRGTSDALSLQGGQPWETIRALLQKEMKDKPDNTNNRFALAARLNRLISEGPFPFWGCPKRDELTTLSVKKSREHTESDIPEYRLSEIFAQSTKKLRPQPIWKIAYAGAVGGQSMTGIPVVHKLRSQFEDMRIWPFEMPLEEATDEALEGVSIVATEIYPSMLPVQVNDGEIKDEAQVRIIAEHFANLDDTNKLGKFFATGKSLSDAEKHVISSEEGWIFGV